MRNSFWTKTANGNIAHVNGASNTQPDAIAAIHAVIDAAVERMKNEPPPQTWAIEIKDGSGNWFRLFSAPSKDRALKQWDKISAHEEYRLVDPLGNATVVPAHTGEPETCAVCQGAGRIKRFGAIAIETCYGCDGSGTIGGDRP